MQAAWNEYSKCSSGLWNKTVSCVCEYESVKLKVVVGDVAAVSIVNWVLIEGWAVLAVFCWLVSLLLYACSLQSFLIARKTTVSQRSLQQVQ